MPNPADPFKCHDFKSPQCPAAGSPRCPSWARRHASQFATMPSTVPGGGQPVVSVLGAQAHALLKPPGVQHCASGTSWPPSVARQDHRLLRERNLPPGSSSCSQPGPFRPALTCY